VAKERDAHSSADKVETGIDKAHERLLLFGLPHELQRHRRLLKGGVVGDADRDDGQGTRQWQVELCVHSRSDEAQARAANAAVASTSCLNEKLHWHGVHEEGVEVRTLHLPVELDLNAGFTPGAAGDVEGSKPPAQLPHKGHVEVHSRSDEW